MSGPDQNVGTDICEKFRNCLKPTNTRFLSIFFNSHLSTSHPGKIKGGLVLVIFDKEPLLVERGNRHRLM